METTPAAGEAPTTARRDDRLAGVVEAVTTRGRVRVDELSAELGISASSLRRDLAVLEQRGLVRRVHGGATSVPGALLPVRYRRTRQRDAKARIAAAAVEQIPQRPGAVALCGGTTTTEVARRLVGRTELTIVTNAVNIAVELAAHPRMRVIVAGGSLRPESYEAVGPMTDRFVEGLNFGVTVMGVDGISAEGGLTTHDAVEARTDQGFAERSQRLVVVADSSKVGRVTLSRIVPLSRAALLVTDVDAPADAVDRLRDAGLEVLLV